VVWNLAELSLYPGDSVFYWAKTRDNKPFGKLQMSCSDTFFFRLPTFEEFHKRITEKEDDAQKAMSSVQKMQKNMKERLETLIKSAKGKETLSWEEKKIVEELDKSMREQTDSLNKAVEALQEAVEKIKESSLNDEILDRMSEVQKALKEILEEYGDSLLFKQPEKDERISWRDLKKSVDKMAKMLPDIREHLDNALKYLEMLRKENERAILAEQAKRLAQEQMELAQSDESESKNLPMQKDLTQRTKDFLEDAKDKLTGDKDSPVGMKEVPSMQQTSSLQKAMQSSLSKHRMPSKNSMHQMSASLQSLSEELESTLSSNLYAKIMQDRERLLNMAQDVMNISQWQGDLAQSMDPDADKKLAALEQQALRDALRKSMGKLDSLEVVPPSMIQGILQKKDKAMSSMDRALQQMSGSRGKSGMKGSATSLNDLASSLLASADNLTKGCSGGGQGGMGGMMGGLQRMSAKQAAINSATSDLLRQMLSQSGKTGSGKKDGQGSQGQGPAMENARKAAQNAQKQLADQLKELSDKFGGDSEKSLTKRVKELEEEARRIAKMLENPTPQVADRQDRFLVRMLQTTLSLHKQDEGKEERKSKSATVIFSNNAVKVDKATFNKTDTFYNLRLKALDGNFPDSYRRQVQAYFDSLSVLFLKEK
jgi:tetratricopeptide (TPR) repeat protein